MAQTPGRRKHRPRNRPARCDRHGQFQLEPRALPATASVAQGPASRNGSIHRRSGRNLWHAIRPWLGSTDPEHAPGVLEHGQPAISPRPALRPGTHRILDRSEPARAAGRTTVRQASRRGRARTDAKLRRCRARTARLVRGSRHPTRIARVGRSRTGRADRVHQTRRRFMDFTIARQRHWHDRPHHPKLLPAGRGIVSAESRVGQGILGR